jgi:hypothetical protein
LPTAQNTVEYQPLMREKKGKNRVSAMWTRLAHQAPAIIHTLFPPTGWKNFDTAEPWGRFGNRSPLKQGTLRISLPNDARFVLSRSLFRSLLRDAGLQDLRLRRRRVISLLSGTEQHMKTRPTLKTLVFCIVLSIAPIAGCDVVTDWNTAALNAIRVGRTTPPEASRALAILHARR